ncbi:MULTISPECIES: NAD(P)-dependent oxidoreductase [unclassified Leifsonia]|uniref:NAD(P)-dependent oxidoreductase n=1 Tax=unclassified Leifsonia TaxID=2663824 RepID=UPI0006F3F7D5|nr:MULTISPECIES: NAD(P)-dependent oxidoreductase [unclassified Leifsonia]KQX08131.1 2-hydroxy-3-oxopropionate reductase [Leifsonia sp. Root1293]KRA12412.1 2-hydroxy-3-oxopropionate reductase [Leifsonia sp. Root60]
MSAPDVALLGLGRMGEPIARRLLASRGALTVWNRSPDKAAALVEAGASLAATPADAAASVTLTVLTDLVDVEQLLEGDGGLLAGWRRNGVPAPVLVVHGTVSPVAVAELGEQLALHGVAVVDAPLSGGVAGAESGALSVMVGGAPDAVERAWPVLDAVGSTVLHLGPLGSGEVAKACNQVVVAATVAALSEALVLADATGIDRGQLLQLLGGGLAASEVLAQKRDRWLSGDFDGGGSSANQLKDLRFVAEAARSTGLTLPVATALEQVFERAVQDGDGVLDHSAVELSIARHGAAAAVAPSVAPSGSD